VLAALEPGDREVITLRVLHGCSLQETAGRLGVTPDQVRDLQRDALARALAIAQEAR
jgi:DNA-directed RNA polymerase specialized sigma24 family protein